MAAFRFCCLPAKVDRFCFEAKIAQECLKCADIIKEYNFTMRSGYWVYIIETISIVLVCVSKSKRDWSLEKGDFLLNFRNLMKCQSVDHWQSCLKLGLITLSVWPVYTEDYMHEKLSVYLVIKALILIFNHQHFGAWGKKRPPSTFSTPCPQSKV